MNDVNSLSHTSWNCKYHVVFAPKYKRRKPSRGGKIGTARIIWSGSKKLGKTLLRYGWEKGIIITAKGELALQAERKGLPSTHTPDADNAAVGITA